MIPDRKEAKEMYEQMMNLFYDFLDGKEKPWQSLDELKIKFGLHEQTKWLAEVGKQNRYEVFDGYNTGEKPELLYILTIHTPEVDKRVNNILEKLTGKFLDEKAVLVREIEIKNKQYKKITSRLLNQGTEISYVDNIEAIQAVFAAEKYLDQKKGALLRNPNPENRRKLGSELKNFMIGFTTRVDSVLLPGLLKEMEQRKPAVAIMGINDYTVGRIIPNKLIEEQIPYITLAPKGPIEVEENV